MSTYNTRKIKEAEQEAALPSPDGLTPWQELAFDCRIARAIEISLAGAHSLRLIGHPANGERPFLALHETLPPESASLAWAWVKPCACGYLGDPARDCPCSLRLAQRFQRRIAAAHFDLSLRVIQPRERDLVARRHCESLKIVLNRIGERRPLISRIPHHLDPAGQQLLRAAMDKLGFTLDQRRTILDVSRTIAALAGSATIRVFHLAEAIQCQDYTPSRPPTA